MRFLIISSTERKTFSLCFLIGINPCAYVNYLKRLWKIFFFLFSLSFTFASYRFPSLVCADENFFSQTKNKYWTTWLEVIREIAQPEKNRKKKIFTFFYLFVRLVKKINSMKLTWTVTDSRYLFFDVVVSFSSRCCCFICNCMN